MIRTFIAVDLSNEIKERIKDIHQQFVGYAVRSVDPDLAHITIKFLGDIPEDKVGPIKDALGRIHCSPFDIDIEGIGVFPNLGYIRIIWVSAKGDFKELHQGVEAALNPLGFPPDNRKFTAHATLARVKNIPKEQKKSLASKISQLSDAKLGRMKVDCIRFKKSTLTPKGPIYDTLHEVRL
ncbi:MAG: RNA 2',3'-cyclic phosphodiesterase [Methanocellales archaeon]|nr:RNA 2',3'-cyclic phosphodiesterase [Methanocellales archaeon]MDD3292378.1 RNA 2',3'-cyclic phosphodiesterase [Methanocellales archaeon]MDD5235909.1 RNA 2',3'-cyclic phosphodiesterase [Methanocellales archaeon]MDD5485866.1 RNA 2',3'-cyclic phosphodiesterase [Methanocellales archaeon]